MGSRRFQHATLQVLVAALAIAPVSARQGNDDGLSAWSAAAGTARIDSATQSNVARFLDDPYVRRERVTIETAALDLVVVVGNGAEARAQQLVDAATAALTRLHDWFGALPAATLTVVDIPWHARLAGAAYPGVIVTSGRWLQTPREAGIERPLLAGLARQYTFAVADSKASDDAFEEGFALYLGTRLIHEELEGRFFDTPRFFGGFIPFSLRAVLISPNPTDPRPRVLHLADVEQPPVAPWRAASAAAGSDAQRIALGLHTLERFLGWPAFQQTLATFWQHDERTATIDQLATAASTVRGADLRWYFDSVLRANGSVDFTIENFSSTATGAEFLSNVVVRREGTIELPARALQVLTRFGDGAEVAEWLDGRQSEWRFEYRSKAPATLTSVDPYAVWLVDADRRNNTRTIDPPRNMLGIRLTLNWIVWLQDAMLAYTALL